MNPTEYFKNKNILVTGGTGSFGHYITSELIKFKPKKIVIFSNDEDQQYHMQNEFKEYSDILEFMFGDVREYSRVFEATKNIDIVYHAAALKHVPMGESHPFEVVKTNVIGAENVRQAAIENNVEVVVTISTDKAVKPVNVMGMTKAIQERIMLNPANGKYKTKFVCVRYGNVIGSRGSVIPYFKKRIEKGEFLPVTSFKMTRFLLRLKEAMELVFKATIEGKSGQLFVKKMPACYIVDLAKAMAKAITGREDYPIKEVGIRPGEKIHEVLVSEEEMRRAVETEDYYIIYPYGKLKKPKLLKKLHEYSSNNTRILNIEEIISLLKKERWV
jgi:FlaA1/EpsC-like NDP-sugar epimerase